MTAADRLEQAVAQRVAVASARREERRAVVAYLRRLAATHEACALAHTEETASFEIVIDAAAFATVMAAAEEIDLGQHLG